MTKNSPSSPATPESPTRIAAVQFLNTISLIEGLETWNGCTLTKAIPSRIAQMLVDNQADIGLASIVDAADPQNDLALIPAGMIGCDGPTLTVRLFSSVPPEQITRVHADKAEFVPYDARERMSDDDAPTNPDEAWPETLLLIGDKVVVDSPPAVRYPHQIDLGEAWHTLTGLPFVYACWMCRRADLGTPMVDEASAMLERVRLRNTQRLDWLREYIGELLKFNLDDRARQAVAVFFDKLRAHALIDARQPVWHETPAPTPAAH